MDVDFAVLLLRLALIVLLYTFLLLVLAAVWRDLHIAESLHASAIDSAQPWLRLVVLEPAGSGLPVGTELRFMASGTVGRTEPNTAVLADPSVSARHARLSYRHGQWWLEDLGSANGTYLNGVALQAPAVVADNDEVDIAQVKLRLEIG